MVVGHYSTEIGGRVRREVDGEGPRTDVYGPDRPGDTGEVRKTRFRPLRVDSRNTPNVSLNRTDSDLPPGHKGVQGV